ncbi:MAG: macro domain-containing protein [Prevotellaceae bacterium]|nr:macro domain-containing protein [Prevotellaceae bacterium]
MMKYLEGDILFSKCQTIVNPVNCVGVMGKGLALRFKRKYPRMFERYKWYCDNHQLAPGKLWLYPTRDKGFVMCFPTKTDWKLPSKIEYIEEGLQKFVSTYKDKKITSVAFPLLGAGLGGIDENVSMELLKKYLSPIDIPVEIYTRYVPQSEKIIRCMEEFCGELEEKDKERIRKEICYE